MSMEAPILQSMTAPPARGGEPPAPSRTAGKARQVLVLGLKFAIAGGVLAWLFASGRLRPADVRQALASPGALAFCVVAVGANVALAALRWWFLIRAQGIEIPFLGTLRLMLIGMFFNTFMPGAVGGDPFKIYYVAEHAPPGKKVEAGTTVFLDRLVGLFTLCTIVFASVLLQPLLGRGDDVFREVVARLGERLGPLARPLGGLAIGGLLGVTVILHPRVPKPRFLARAMERLLTAGGARVWGTLVHATRRRGALVAAFIASCFSHTATILAFYVVGHALGDELDLPRYFLLVPVGLMVQAVPGPPGGLGVGEAAFATLFAIATRSSATVAGTVCMVWHLVIYGYNLVGGVAYLLHQRRLKGAEVLEEPAAQSA